MTRQSSATGVPAASNRGRSARRASSLRARVQPADRERVRSHDHRGVQLVGLARGPVAVARERLGGALEREPGSARVDLRDGVEAELQRGHDAEVRAAAAHGPEEVGVAVRGRRHEAPVGGDDVHSQQAVGGETVLARQPAEAAAERVAGDADARASCRRSAPARAVRRRRSRRPSVAPGPTRAVWRSGSTSTSAICEVFSSRPPSAGTSVPCPVAWTANGRSCSCAVRTAARTSAGVSASATIAGRGSIRLFHVTRSSS